MTKRADLHIHTHFSDGTFQPQEVVEKAKDVGLAAIAITDHDSVDGIPLAQEAGRKLTVEIIPAVELTAEEKDIEIHILGYFIDYENVIFGEFLKKLKDERIERALKMISKLQNLGVDINIEDILKTAGPGAIGRLHFANCLKEKGYIKNIYDAFNKYIGEGKPAYVKRKRLLPQEAIKVIERLGGVSVIAHPHSIKNERILEDLIKMGIEGLEVYHSDHSKRTSEYFLKLARNYGLIVTGGSDCHGLRKEKELMGTISVPYDVVEELRRKSLAKK